MKLLTKSYDEEFEPDFADRVAEELKKLMEEEKINLCNDEVMIFIEVAKT